MKFIRTLLTDLAGFGLILLGLLTGWLPGPGGIPLILAGLGLLSINHEWARRLLRFVKDNGVRLADTFFKDHPVLVIFYDIAAFGLLIAGVLILMNIHGVFKAGATVCFFLGVALLLGNRKRLQRITRFFRKENRQP